jgi:hypothetical protein
MPQAGEEFVYEMVLKCLLLPGANGVPTWKSENAGEKMMIKLPEQFRDLFANKPQLSEDIGQKLAEWAAGAGRAHRTPPSSSRRYEACSDPATLRALEERQTLWKACPADLKKKLKESADAATERVNAADRKEPAVVQAGEDQPENTERIDPTARA